ncbi:hypothetical protein FGADI_7864 [Fusarium gaditjirri]|uniref:Uncharacterized protein n=1 Tax=Fusarium gaditjirri TaxID=282569 RepID=A0A8H4T406_9HYPO|nr:hypothetical protein FGADI_7864 [Fusarium gaditjirri]
MNFAGAQAKDQDGDIQMCHPHCWELDAGPLQDYLEEISEWVGKTPDEVVKILLTNIDALPIEKFDETFTSAGLKGLGFRPKAKLSRAKWPPLQKLLDERTRLVVFIDYSLDEGKIDYILDEFDYFWKTLFEGDPTQLMGIMDHMLNHEVLGIVIPNQADANKTNSEYSIQTRQTFARATGAGDQMSFSWIVLTLERQWAPRYL